MDSNGNDRMGSTLTIDFGSIEGAVTEVLTDCVIDLSSLGRVVGIEIINLALLSGSRPLGARGNAILNSRREVQWSYDQEVDAFYVQIGDKRSLDQRCADCIVLGDDAGHIAKIVVKIE